MVLVFMQNLCLVSPGGWGDLPVFFPVFQWQLLSQLLRQWGVASIRFWSSALWPTSCVALELGFCCVGLLVACFFASHLFSWARSGICQPALCCKCVMLVCWLFFNFATLFDFGCCSLAQEMSFVDHYLPYFIHWLITCTLLALLPFQSLFTESSCGDQLLAPPPSPVCLWHPDPLLHVLFSSLFVIQVFFCGVGGNSAHGAMLIYPRGSCGNTGCCFCWPVRLGPQ
jgi:hypothetical protein